MRRLPVFFLLDCSESMVGEKLSQMEEGLSTIVKTLRSDPHALETVYISIIAFAGIAKTIAPLIELASFYPPKLPIGGGTSLGAALEVLMASIDNSVIKTTSDQKGDWKPIVYLFTDGHPTDNFNQAVSRWNSAYAKKVTLIAVGLGKSADFGVLRLLTENVIAFEYAQEGDFKKFINWVTASIVAQSKSVGEGTNANGFPSLDERVLKIVKDPPSAVADETCVTLIGRCQKTRKPYIIKYEKDTQDLAVSEIRIEVPFFTLAGCYPLEEDYFAWSDPKTLNLKVNTSELKGTPGCPYCGAQSAFAVCHCGKILCIDKLNEVQCPWCENNVSFSPTSSDVSGFDVNRSRG